eukprot:CAMPEP_0168511490 /NCGR_PEP_ID=MMETSP0405-20121227/2165_1 /TAXON_ID=498012 /ORGANISM="Trichosphaerium sp, Strain Am-I-7 wt" /LENGTH=208 /DNA_ID=CAMNT_0008529675 /DNA_START=64 /DNA_END=690 /DNA_ORIENTATION=+
MAVPKRAGSKIVYEGVEETDIDLADWMLMRSNTKGAHVTTRRYFVISGNTLTGYEPDKSVTRRLSVSRPATLKKGLTIKLSSKMHIYKLNRDPKKGKEFMIKLRRHQLYLFAQTEAKRDKWVKHLQDVKIKAAEEEEQSEVGYEPSVYIEKTNTTNSKPSFKANFAQEKIDKGEKTVGLGRVGDVVVSSWLSEAGYYDWLSSVDKNFP